MIIENDDYIYIACIVLQAGLLVYFIRRAVIAYRTKKTKETVANTPPPNTYEYTRNLALSVTPQQLGLSISPSLHKVYGVVMDWDMSGTILTLNAYITGAANIAMSNGAVLTGVGKNPAVAEEAAQFVQVAENFLGRALPVSSTGMPPRGTVRFYFLTNRGLFAVQEQLSAINDETSPLMMLFLRGNMVIDEIKKGG